MALRAAHDGVDAGDQLVLVEWLGHVVIGADAETLHLVLNAGEAGQDQDRGFDLGNPKLLEHLVARHVGQIEVEQDDVVIIQLAEIDAFFSEIRRVDVEALGFEHQLDRLRSGAVIFYQQYAHASPLIVATPGVRSAAQLAALERLCTTDSNPDETWLTKADSCLQALFVQIMPNRLKMLQRSGFSYPCKFKFV